MKPNGVRTTENATRINPLFFFFAFYFELIPAAESVRPTASS